MTIIKMQDGTTIETDSLKLISGDRNEGITVIDGEAIELYQGEGIRKSEGNEWTDTEGETWRVVRNGDELTWEN